MYHALPFMSVFEPKELRILVISDSHSHGGYLNGLANWLSAIKPTYDMVFLLGNMCNLTNRLRYDYMAEMQAIGQFRDTIKFLKANLNVPIIYIPGNTEATEIYSLNYEIMEILNLHKRSVPIDEGLILVGLGGSLPAKKNEQDVLEGYPYEKADDFANDLNFCIKTADVFGPEASYLLLTHIGPAESMTTDVYLENDNVNAGFKGFADVVKDKNFIGLIHGHSADSQGMTKPFDISMPVINPGGLISGKFGELTLRRNMMGRWKIGEVQFRSLN